MAVAGMLVPENGCSSISAKACPVALDAPCAPTRTATIAPGGTAASAREAAFAYTYCPRAADGFCAVVENRSVQVLPPSVEYDALILNAVPGVAALLPT